MSRIGRSSSLTRQPLAVRRRSDLVIVQTKHKHESAIVVKDPIAMKYHRLRPDEYFVLCQLDGISSLDSIRESYEQIYAPTKVSAADINQLLFRFHQFGLTLSDTTLQGERLCAVRDKERKQKRMQLIGSVLSIRFPGVDPEPLLRRLYPWVRPGMNLWGMMIYAIVVLVAAIVFASHASRFSGELPSMQQWMNLRSVLILGSVIGLTKVFHELGHALTCKHFGGECHQIGPMLLVFTPALYCDTSDSWMLPSRWARAAVGLAGIAVEVALAALATFVWISTGPGLVHTIAMNVMIVCSVSTLVFNANPLLRYDGYYVLSDACDFPNLGDRSRKLLVNTSNRWMWGIAEEMAEWFSSGQKFWLIAYASAAAVYRWTLTLAVVYVVMIMLRPYRLESIGRVLAMFAVGGTVFMLMRPFYQFLSHPGRRRKIKMNRSILSIALLSLLFVGSLVPLPSWVSVNGRLVPRSESPIYVSSEGRLDQLLAKPGDQIKSGQPIAVLSNPETSLQCLAAKGRYEAQLAKLDATRAQAISNSESASQLPSMQATLDEFEKQFRRRQARLDSLTVSAPADGRLIAGPKLNPAPRDANDLNLVNWTGSPTDPHNANCWLQSGTELMSLQTDPNHDAEILLDQVLVRRFDVGSAVKLIASDDPQRILRGRVTNVSRTDYDPKMDAARRDDPRAGEQLTPPGTLYLVRIELDDSENLKPDVRVEGHVVAHDRSVAGRIYESLSSLLRFR
jgi:putative peptide zinc metalloprotease protein